MTTPSTGPGVSRWTTTRLELIEALLAAEAAGITAPEMADAILSRLTPAEAPELAGPDLDRLRQMLDEPAQVPAMADEIARLRHLLAGYAGAAEEAEAGPGSDMRPPSEPAMDLLEAAWGIIANAGEGDWSSQAAEWREAAGKWRDRYHIALRAFCAAPPAREPEPLPPGVYGRIELPGFRSHTGWMTPGMLAGQPVAVISDRDGQVLAEYIPGPASRFVRLPVPVASQSGEPERPALHAGTGWYDDDRDDDYDAEGPF